VGSAGGLDGGLWQWHRKRDRNGLARRWQPPDRPWLAGGAARAQLPEPFICDRLLMMMDEAGIGRAVIVPHRRVETVAATIALAKFPKVSVNCHRRRPIPSSPIRSAT